MKVACGLARDNSTWGSGKVNLDWSRASTIRRKP